MWCSKCCSPLDSLMNCLVRTYTCIYWIVWSFVIHISNIGSLKMQLDFGCSLFFWMKQPSCGLISWHQIQLLLGRKWKRSSFWSISHPQRIVQFMNEITSFVQMDNEPFYDTWEWFKVLLRTCPCHGIQPLCKYKHFMIGWWLKPNQEDR